MIAFDDNELTIASIPKEFLPSYVVTLCIISYSIIPTLVIIISSHEKFYDFIR